MTGTQFENYLATELSKNDNIVVKVARGTDGSQLCDLIQINHFSKTLIECKVIANGTRFSFSRIEDNQFYTMKRAEKLHFLKDYWFYFWTHQGIFKINGAKILKLLKLNTKSVDVELEGIKCD